ncbi:hypothetical protein TNCV_1891301 [Trichonephila clavipes]|nr:hypothetical protein TNCV_1891301 [Trichonephila clavipes]
MADRSSHECLKCGQGYPTARELLIHEVLHYDNVKPVPIFALTKLPPSENGILQDYRDVEDGLVNGAIGTLKYIEYLTEDEQVTIYGTTEVDVEPQPSTSTGIRKSFGWSFQIQAWANYVE